ncbi:Ig-like domain-containing protein [Caldithrix abyssi]
MMKINKIFLTIVSFNLFFAILQAQTSHFQLIWDNNTEDDMYMYRIYRGNNANQLQQIDSVYFPDSTYNDYRIQKGALYYYAIKAVDLSLNASDFSDQVSAAIPQITQFPEQVECPPDTTISYTLADHVNDPDHSPTDIHWQVSGYNQLQVTLDNNAGLLTVVTPSNWAGQDRMDLTATDPDGFEDRVSIYFVAKNGSLPPELNTIPAQTTPEDTPLTLNLLQFADDGDTAPDQLKFTVSDGDHLTLHLKDSLLTIIPEKDWFGSSTVKVEVEDEKQLTDSTSFEVAVTPVNDPPVLSSLPNFKLNQDTSVSINLNDYVYDVDDDNASLRWEFANYPHLELEYNQSSQSLTIITPADWAGFEYIIAKVADANNAFAQDTITVQVLSKEVKAPVISAFPDIRINEDETTSIDLNKYVQDADTPIQNLFWQTHGHTNTVVSIDYQNKILHVGGKPDWFGEEQFWLKVSDPDQQADSVLVKVTVLPVNDPPFFKGFPVVDLSEQNPKSIAYKNYISDVDNSSDELYLRFLEVDSIQVTINDAAIWFEVSEQWFGSAEITLIVQDPAGAADSIQTLVYRQNLARAPRIVNLDTLHIDEDRWRKLSLSDKVDDPDTDKENINWEILPGQNVSVQLDQTSKEATLQPAPDWWGEEEVVFKATDPDGYFDFDTLKVYVRPINDPPELKTIPDQTMLAGTYYSFDLKEYLYDADGYDDLANIELLNNPNGYIGYYLTENGFRATFFAPQGFHGNETFMLRVTDRAGAQAVAIFVVRVLAKTVKDKIDVNSFGSGTVIYFSWNSRMPTRDYIEYSLDYSFEQRSEMEAEFTRVHQVTLKDLEPNQTYHFRIVSLDENGNVIVNPDSVFTTGKPVTGVNVFPIPYRKSDPDAGDGIYFTNLNGNATITILNLLGELVFKKEINEAVFRWDVKNTAGHEVRSGIYFYHIKTDKKNYRGKLIIIR